MLQIFEETKTMLKISSRDSTVSLLIKICLPSSLSSSSNEVFLTAGIVNY